MKVWSAAFQSLGHLLCCGIVFGYAFVGFTRVRDYWHHTVDVLTGCVHMCSSYNITSHIYYGEGGETHLIPGSLVQLDNWSRGSICSIQLRRKRAL